MKIDPRTGLVELLDVSGPAPVSVKMHPVDVRDALSRGKKKDGTLIYVLAEDYVAPEPA